MKKVLLITDGIFHPTLLGRLALYKAMGHPLPSGVPHGNGKEFGVMKEFQFTHISSLDKLPPTLDIFSALVLHYHHRTISDAAFGRFETYVKGGGGILAIHAATASFKDRRPYFKILGGQFIGHGKVENFELKRVRDDIFSGIDNFVVKDELYIHELEQGIEVHFIAKHEGNDIPVVWTHRYGKGKICYAVPGHTTESMRNKTYQQVLRRGLAWVINE